MSQVKLTLRPPPNVDFVHGYPGIPPGAPDRPQAAVKGAIEVRVGPQGVKAKWVRIELRKVETLPGGGQANTFYDFVGPSPVNLWNSSDEYGLLRTQDFPFSIRIPESIPPSIALENRAGIKYELLASVCTKGKKGFLRKRKSIVVSTMAAIIIDKHELHSTWPVYCQPESRHLAQDGVTLTVDRNHTCYGPGDRVSVTAIVKSDSLHTVILRGFELTLKESTIFRAGPYSGKKSAPQVRVMTISENKFPVNATLYGGTQHKADLMCGISPNHTTTTLNAARHIDITYVLSVKALMGTGTHLIMDLPIIVSNWQRNVSFEAIRRIGPAPSLSLLPPNTTAQSSPSTPVAGPAPPAAISSPPPQPARVDPFSSRPPVSANLSQSFAGRPSQRPETDSSFGRSPSATAQSTLPTSLSNGYTASTINKADEFGYGRSTAKAGAPMDSAAYGNRITQPSHKATNSRSSSFQADDLSPKPAITTTTVGSRRPASARATSGTNRFTITNATPSEIPEDTETPPQRRPSTGGSGVPSTTNATGTSSRSPWPTAAEEKQRLYEKARAQVEKVQGSVARGPTPPPAKTQTTPPPQPVADTAPKAQVARTTSRSTPWPTAEEEKMRLFNQAQAAVKKTQGHVYTPPPTQDKNHFDLNGSGSGSQPSGSSFVAPTADPVSITSSPTKSPPKAPVPQYLTAEQEKAALKRYHEAKQAVDRTQKTIGFTAIDDGKAESSSTPSSPIAYESLYPSAKPSGSKPTPGDSDMPPPFDAPADLPSHLSEKERLRRAYEVQDAASVMRQTSSRVNRTPSFSPPPFSETSAGGSTQVISEKEMLRRRFEAQDAEAMAAGGTSPQPPPRKVSVSSLTGRPRPVPPAASGSSKVLSAAEEKALLRAKYNDEEPKPRVNGSSIPTETNTPTPSGTLVPPAPPAPPPLMPRPPVEYIQETQEEDARVSRFAINGILPPMDDEVIPDTTRETAAVNLGSSTSNTSSLDNGPINIPGPPPPLPPKPPSE